MSYALLPTALTHLLYAPEAPHLSLRLVSKLVPEASLHTCRRCNGSKRFIGHTL